MLCNLSGGTPSCCNHIRLLVRKEHIINEDVNHSPEIVYTKQMSNFPRCNADHNWGCPLSHTIRLPKICVRSCFALPMCSAVQPNVRITVVVANLCVFAMSLASGQKKTKGIYSVNQIHYQHRNWDSELQSTALGNNVKNMHSVCFLICYHLSTLWSPCLLLLRTSSAQTLLGSVFVLVKLNFIPK
jgi:hypothetical protein